MAHLPHTRHTRVPLMNSAHKCSTEATDNLRIICIIGEQVPQPTLLLLAEHVGSQVQAAAGVAVLVVVEAHQLHV